jgi:hypothetical protein
MNKIVVVKFTNGTKYGFPISETGSHTVSLLKNQIEDFLKIKKETIRLICMGSPLEDHYNLINVPDKTVIHLVSQLAKIDEEQVIP